MRRIGKTNIGCIIAFIILGVFVFAMIKIIPVKVDAANFKDYMKERAAYASVRSMEQIRNDCLKKADELGIPLRPENLELRRVSDDLLYNAEWEQDVDILGYVYTMKFRAKGRAPIISGL